MVALCQEAASLTASHSGYILCFRYMHSVLRWSYFYSVEILLYLDCTTGSWEGVFSRSSVSLVS